VGAVVKASHRRIWFKVASHWPGADLLTRAVIAVKQHVLELQEVWRGLNLLSDKDRDLKFPRKSNRIELVTLETTRRGLHL
jgi:hypothetical protein